MKFFHQDAAGMGSTLGGLPAIAAIFMLAGFLPTSPVFAQFSLTSTEALGKQIYFKGTGSTEIVAAIGESDTLVPGSAVPCANCHGYDGLGRPEGGVVPSYVTWGYLTKPYGHTHSTGRRHPAFNEQTIAVAIGEGRDPAGNALESTMPRYRLSDKDLAAVVAYLKRLQIDLDPGLTNDAIKIGTLLPIKGALGSLGRTVEATLKAYFEAVNMRGGIYGRKIHLKVAEYTGDAVSTLANAKHLVEQEQVFALVGAFAAGLERELFPLFENNKVPQVGPFTVFAGHSDFQSRATFFPLSGLPDQARALVDYAVLKLALAPSGIAVLLSANEIYGDVGKAIERQSRTRGWPAPTVVPYTGGRAEAVRRVGELKRARVEAVFYFGPASGLGLLTAEAAKQGWLPYLFVSGLTTGRAIFDVVPAFSDRLFLAYPAVPSDQTRKGLTEFELFRDGHGLSKRHLAAQISAYIAAKVLVEGLRRSGKALSRASLVAALEHLNEFDTGLTPPLSFGPNRRVGALGAHVLSADLEKKIFRRQSVWMPLN